MSEFGIDWAWLLASFDRPALLFVEKLFAILTPVAVVGTLLAMVYSNRMLTKSLRLNSLQQIIGQMDDVRKFRIQRPDVERILFPSRRSWTDEQIQTHLLKVQLTNQLEWAYLAHEAGAIDDSIWNAWVRTWKTVILQNETDEEAPKKGTFDRRVFTFARRNKMRRDLDKIMVPAENSAGGSQPYHRLQDDVQWPRASKILKDPSEVRDGALAVALYGVPLSISSISPSSADQTPQAIREALGRFSQYGAFVGPDGDKAVDLGKVEVADFGDLPIAQLENEKAQREIKEYLESQTQQAHALSLLLGGDNAITRPAMNAVCELSKAGLITLDAHHDVRSLDNGRSNGTPVRGLVEEDGLQGANVVQIGLSSFTNSAEYEKWAKQQGIRLFSVADVRKRTCATIMQEALDQLAERCETIYVDLDVDVLDRAFAPGCPGARPGGLLPYELHVAAYLAGLHRKVVAIDIVEVDATRDRDGLSVQNAALCVLHALAGFGERARPGVPTVA